MRHTVRFHRTSVNNIYHRHFGEYVAGVWWCIAVCKADEGRHWGVFYLSVRMSIKIVVITLHNIEFILNIVFGNFGVFLCSG